MAQQQQQQVWWEAIDVPNAIASKAFANETIIVGGSIAIGGLMTIDAAGGMTAQVISLRADNNRKMNDTHMQPYVQQLMQNIIAATTDPETELIRDLDGNNRFRAGNFKPVIVNGAAVRQGYGLIHAPIRRAWQVLNVADIGERLW